MCCGCRRCACRRDRKRAPPRRRPRASSRCCSKTTSLLAIDKPAGVAVHGGSGVSFGVIEQLRTGTARGSLPGTGASPRPRNLRHPAGGQEAQRPDRAAGPVPRARDRQDLPGAGRRRAGRPTRRCSTRRWPSTCCPAPAGAAEGERRVRVVAKDHPDAMRAVTLVEGARPLPAPRRCRAGLAAGRDHQDRPHPSDPRPPRVGRSCRSPATTSTATSSATGRLQKARPQTHVPARVAPAVHPSRERRAHGAPGRPAAGTACTDAPRRARQRSRPILSTTPHD